MPTEWDVNPLEFMGEVRMKHKKLCEEVAKEIFAGVIERTPVISGNLRASWDLNQTGDAIDVSSGSEGSPAPAPKIPKTIPNLPDYPVLYVTNGKAYAPLVENGSPHNEARKMVALTLESLKS